MFVDGPIQIKPLPSLSNPDPAEPSPDDPPEKQARAWWRQVDEGYHGWGETAKYMQAQFHEHGPFDGVMGFSQGGCLAGILTAALEHPELVPNSPGPFQAEPFRFAISISGFRPADHSFDPLMEAKITTPMLAMIGIDDVIVPPDWTMALVEQCTNARVINHEGGHFLPTPAPWRNFIRNYLETFQSDTPGAWRTIAAPTANVEVDDTPDWKL